MCSLLVWGRRCSCRQHAPMNVTQHMPGSERGTLGEHLRRELWVNLSYIVTPLHIPPTRRIAVPVAAGKCRQSASRLEGKWEKSWQKMADSKYFPRKPLQRSGYGNIYSLNQAVFHSYFRWNTHFLHLTLFIFVSYCHFDLDFLVCPIPLTNRAAGFPNKATGSCLSPHVITAGLCVREPRKRENHNLFWKVSCLSAWRNVKIALVTHPLKVERRWIWAYMPSSLQA